jgi:adenylate cyclase
MDKSPSIKRWLAAILTADITGYSRLMGQDEAATVHDLKGHQAVILPLVAHHGGRIMDTAGDGILAVFRSVIGATQCAVAIQTVMAARNKDEPENRRMLFRIGVNLGDVIHDNTRIYGDGINVAARLEALAAPGGVLVSQAVHDQVRDRLDLAFEDLGEREFKNIARPVRVYRLRTPAESKTVPAPGVSLQLPDKPSIAVLPILNMIDDPEQEYFSDGMTEEIITGLAKIPTLFVIARNSTFTYKGKPVKVQEVGKELCVKYVLEGSVRKAGDRVRIAAQLIDIATGHHLWAERYDRDLRDIFALQDEITMKILVALQVKLTEGEQVHLRAEKDPTHNLEAYQKVLQGREYLRKSNMDDNTTARQLCEEAIRLDSQYAYAYTMLAWTYVHEIVYSRPKNLGLLIEKATDLVQKSLTLKDSLDFAHALLGVIYLLQRQFEKAIAAGEQAVALSPNGADNQAYMAVILIFVGKAEEAIVLLQTAIRHNPIPPAFYYCHLGHAFIMTRRYEEAIVEIKKALRHSPDNWYAHYFLTIAYALSDREEKASTASAEIIRIIPKFSVEYIAKIFQYKNNADLKLCIDALRIAGLE